MPVKHEHVILCRMSARQKQLMQGYLESIINDPESSGCIRISPLILFAVCCKIWNHPDIIHNVVKENLSPDDLDVDLPLKKAKNKKKNAKSNLNYFNQNAASLEVQKYLQFNSVSLRIFKDFIN